jgi:hypothetical protein
LRLVRENERVSDEQPRTIHRLVGVYNADGTLLGEVRYFVAARLGRAHCPLCDITRSGNPRYLDDEASLSRAEEAEWAGES